MADEIHMEYRVVDKDTGKCETEGFASADEAWADIERTAADPSEWQVQQRIVGAWAPVDRVDF